MRKAEQAFHATLARLDRAYSSAKALEEYGPEYSSEGAAGAFGGASSVVLANPPGPKESAAAWTERIRMLVRKQLAFYGDQVPACAEAIAAIGP